MIIYKRIIYSQHVNNHDSQWELFAFQLSLVMKSCVLFVPLSLERILYHKFNSTFYHKNVILKNLGYNLLL